ncbi:MAG: DUF4870 domain-containing protein [Blastocatellia bacterium]
MQPVTQDEKTFATLAHLSALAGCIIPFGNILGPLIIWMMKKDQSWFVNDQGKEALNFQITLTIALIVSFLLMFLLIGFILMPVVGLFGLIMAVIAALKANQGEVYRYPLTIRLIQ